MILSIRRKTRGTQWLLYVTEQLNYQTSLSHQTSILLNIYRAFLKHLLLEKDRFMIKEKFKKLFKKRATAEFFFPFLQERN